jgi:hypothetical protein
MTTSSDKSIKQTPPTSLDPNFFLPPDVIDMRYVELDTEDSRVGYTEDGELVGYLYDDATTAEFEEFGQGDTGASSLLSPPDSVTVLAQEVRVTQDGRFVVDVIIEVPDMQGIISFDQSISKAS